MKNLTGQSIEKSRYYPVTKTFEISYDEKSRQFSISKISSKENEFCSNCDTGSFFSADERGSDNGTVRALMNDAFETLQNSGYVSGNNTYELKSIIKSLGFGWNRNEKRWEK